MNRPTNAGLLLKIRELEHNQKSWQKSVEEMRAIANRSRAWAVIEDALVAYKLCWDTWLDAKNLLDSYLGRVEKHAGLGRELLAKGQIDARGAGTAVSVYEHAVLVAGNYANRITAVESMRARAITVLQNGAPLLNDDHAVFDKIMGICGVEAGAKITGWHTPTPTLAPPDEGGRS